MINRESKICPVCGNGVLAPTTLSVVMPEVLKRWEVALSEPFPAAVWQDYANLGDQPLVFNECPACGFGRFEPMVSGTSSFYEAISAQDYYNADKWEFGCAVADLRSAHARRILDVGCGSGQFLGYLREHIGGADLYGFDLNASLLEKLAECGFKTLPSNLDEVKQALEGQPLFDAICLLQVLEHIEEPVQFLQTFLSLLKPGGLLIVTTPNAAGPIRRFPDALTEIPPHHVTRWTESSFTALLPKLGVRVATVRMEPLPDYLWDSYLPVMWDDPIWPAQIFDPIARNRGLQTVGERAGFAAEALRERKVRWLHGVPGHTIYVSADSNDH